MDGLKTSDLIAERNRLEDSISRQQKALEAISIMIDYKESQERTESYHQGTVRHFLPSGKVNLRRECQRFVDQMNGRWFRTRDIMEMVFAAGIRAKKEIFQVRPLVSTYLGQFEKDGYLIKENIGEGGRTEFRFKRTNTEE